MSAGEIVAEADYRDIREFLHDEADALDAREYARWFAMLTPDVAYRVSASVVRDLTAAPQTFPIFDETSATLTRRIAQLSNPRLTHAENPPSFTRRFVSNIRARYGANAGEFAITSSILLYRSRGAASEPWLCAGRRSDLVRRVDGKLQLARRDVQVDESLVRSPNMTSFL